MRVLIDLRLSLPVFYLIEDSIIKSKVGLTRDRDKIVLFLNKGFYLSIMLNDTICLYEEKRISHYETFLTDGNWVWSSDINHYVKEHFFDLPDAFLNYIRDANYKPLKSRLNKLNDIECNLILNKIFDSKGFLNINNIEIKLYDE